MKTYNFKYGHGSVSLSLNEADILAELHGTETPPISDIRSALFASLEQPIDSAPLRQRVRPGDRVALVISDMTRFWMRQDLVIPHLVDYLIDECGVQPEHLTIVVANGTHIGGDEQELRTLVTDGVYNRVRVKNHVCEAKDLAYLGTTPHETPVWIDRTAAEADLVVCLGAGHPSCDGWLRRRTEEHPPRHQRLGDHSPQPCLFAGQHQAPHQPRHRKRACWRETRCTRICARRRHW